MSNADQPLKSNRGRPRNPVPKDDWHVAIERDVSLFWRMHFHDDFTGTTKKNELSNLVNRLLKEEREKLQGGGNGKD